MPRLCYGSIADLRLLIIWAAHLVQTKHILWSNATDLVPLFASLDKCRRKIISSLTHPKLTQPGRVHHILGMQAPHNAHIRLIDTLAEGAKTRFQEMELKTASMFVHHMPDKYEHAIAEAYEGCEDELEGTPREL